MTVVIIKTLRCLRPWVPRTITLHVITIQINYVSKLCFLITEVTLNIKCTEALEESVETDQLICKMPVYFTYLLLFTIYLD